MNGKEQNIDISEESEIQISQVLEDYKQYIKDSRSNKEIVSFREFIKSYFSFE